MECDVRSLEHCNLILIDTAELAVMRDCIACPTLVTFERLNEDGPKLGLPPASIEKIDAVRLSGLGSLSIMETAGLTMAFGSDLLGVMRHHQSDEFKIRAQVLSAQSFIASATSVAAKLLNPLVDISVLCGQREGIPIIKVAGSSKCNPFGANNTRHSAEVVYYLNVCSSAYSACGTSTYPLFLFLSRASKRLCDGNRAP